jgi:hypothetical protein
MPTMRFTLETVAKWVLPRVRAGEVLSTSEHRTLLAVAEVLLEGIQFELEDDELLANVERFLRARSARRAWRARVLLTLVEVAPILLRRRRFSRMSKDERKALIREKFVSGKHIWSICGRVRPLVYIGAYASPKAARHVGWIPVPERARFRDLALHDVRGIRRSSS